MKNTGGMTLVKASSGVLAVMVLIAVLFMRNAESGFLDAFFAIAFIPLAGIVAGLIWNRRSQK